MSEPDELIQAYDPYAAEVNADPFRFYEILQKKCPVHYGPGLDLYTLTRFEDVAAMMLSNDYSATAGPTPRRLGVGEGFGGVLVNADEPEHSRHRKIVNWAFMPRRVQTLEPYIEEVSRSLIDAFVERGEADFAVEYAYRLPVTIIAELYGVADADRESFKGWVDGMAEALCNESEDGYVERLMTAAAEFGGYLFTKAGERRAQLAAGQDIPDDLLSALLKAEVDGEPLNDFEFLAISLQLLLAGHLTTTDLLGSLMYLLATHPGEMAKLRARPELIDNAIEEALRFHTPIAGACRTAKKDLEVNGTSIPTDAKVRAVFEAANRDPLQWGDDADQFRIDRDLSQLRKHLAFGWGSHFCAGAALARAEARIALRDILERLPNVRLDDRADIDVRHDLILRGFYFDALPILFDPPPVTEIPALAAVGEEV